MAASHIDKRTRLRKIAEETLDAIAAGSYAVPNTPLTHALRRRTQFTTQHTQYYAPDSALATWPTAPRLVPPGTLTTAISTLELSTLAGARLLAAQRTPHASDGRLGVLNFASATKPGGGFLTGAQAQEESLARSSTLHPALTCEPARAFYALHARDGKGGYYSHAMLYSPGVVLFRDDAGAWLDPLEVDVLTAAAVNAGVARQTLWGRTAGAAEEKRIERAMRERMARVLCAFERHGAGALVLGSFGTGVFKNDVGMVARVWAELLCAPGSRFRDVFDRVLFAVIGHATFEEFRDVFGAVAASYAS